jgi:23S rRNA (uracil1939-C5)-methyltransferase
VEPVDRVHARLIGIEGAALERITPGCAYFGVCGGCHYQHAPYSYQLLQKLAILREVMQRVGKFTAPDELRVVSGPEWHYRNRVQLHIRDSRIGYLQMGSHELCPVTQCPIASPHINACIRVLTGMAHDRRFPRFVSAVEIFTNEADTQINVMESSRPVAKHFFDWCAECIPGYVPSSLTYTAAGDAFCVSRKSFFQVNRFLIDALVEHALGEANGETAIELYAGVGLFTLPLSRRFRRITAVEAGTSASMDLRYNSENAGAAVQVVRAGVDDFLAGLETAPRFMLADPPRVGLSKTAVSHLIRLRPERLHIVACDPATLARDMKALLDAGYVVEQMTLIDLFPQTFHMETVVHMVAS